MPNFIQSDSLPEIQGSAGDQTPVQKPDYGSAAKKIAGQAVKNLDTYSQVYAKDKAQALVEEELANIDKARAAAENLSPDAEKITPVPDSVRVSQEEWDFLSNAVRNGEMDPTKARLLASSRLRSRIAEEPMFARQLRQAASSVVGFNIESIGAQQYFSSFAKPETKQTEAQKRWALAQQESEVLRIPAEVIYKNMYALDNAKRRKELAKLSVAEGADSLSDAFSVFDKENSETGFNLVIGQLKTTFDSKGYVKEEDWAPVLAESQTAELNELASLWTENNGDKTSAEYARAQEVIKNRYDNWEEHLKTVGYERTMQRLIDRNQMKRTIFTDKHFNREKIVNEVGGQAAVTAYFDAFVGKTPTQMRQMAERYPILSRFLTIGEFTEDELEETLASAGSKLLSGSSSQMTPEEEDVASAAASEVLDTTDDPETQTRVIDELIKKGKEVGALSVLASKRPSNVSIDNINTYKKKYQQDLPAIINKLGVELASWTGETNRFGEPAVSYEIDDRGNIQINSNRPLSLPQGKLEELREYASIVNQYNKGFDNGWGQHVGEDRSQYLAKLKRNINVSGFSKVQVAFKDSVVSGKQAEAKKAFEQMKKYNPDAFSGVTFETLYSEIRRRRLESGQGEE